MRYEELQAIKYFIECPNGTYGQNCTQICQPSFYGKLCSEKCDCTNSSCHHVYGCIATASTCKSNGFTYY